MTTTYEPNMTLETGKYRVIGSRPLRHDGADKVTGRARYGADFSSVGLLHGAALRSEHAHARIKSIDASKAEALPGVAAVVTAADFDSRPRDGLVDLGESTGNVKFMRDNVLASDKVLYKGQVVAGVAAINAHVAGEALGLIDVEYEALPAVLTAQQAMADGASILHEHLRTEEFGETGTEPSNVASHFQHVLGDVDKGFAEADLVIEREFTTETVHQGYIEPHPCTALWNEDGRLHVWTSTQGAFTARNSLAKVLDVPESGVRVVPMEIGGGFGGKINVYLEPVAALLSRKSGHPVKMVMSRADVFEGTGPTPGSYMKMKIGVTNAGKITGAHAYLAFEAGAFPGSPVGAGARCVFAAYDIPNVLVDGFDVVVNKPKTAAYRAPGSTNAAFATETVVDEVAAALDMDPVEFRLLNAAREGTRMADGPVFPRIGLVELLEAMRAHPHYETPIEGPNRGRGVAVGFWFNAGMASSCDITVNPDGTINLIEGSTDIGGTRASIAMQAAEVLGIDAEDVRPTVADTDSVGYTAVTGGSRVTFATGWAAYEAANDVKRQLTARAAAVWDVDEDSIEYADGRVRSKTDPELSMTFRELASRLPDTGGPVVGSAAVDPKGVGGSFAGNIVDVEVDPETGKVDILRFTAFQDAGKAIHPSYVEGQMQGGSAQGIGWGLNEEYFYGGDGRMANSTFLDYRMPTSLDLPMIDTVIVEVPNPGHPFGVRGVGEASIVPPPAALANALYRAAGVRLVHLPMNPVSVTEAIWEGN